VANLSNNKDVFMCILRVHARAGYLQHYETLLKELKDVSDADGSQAGPQDQYDMLIHGCTYQYILVCTSMY
jgi:hypothetical protein